MTFSTVNNVFLPKDVIAQILEEASQEGNPTIQQLASVCKLFRELIGDVCCSYNQTTRCIDFKVNASPHLHTMKIQTISDHLKRCWLREAKEIIKTFGWGDDKILYLIEIAKIEGKMRGFESAKKTLEEAKNVSNSGQAYYKNLSALAMVYAEFGDIFEAKTIANSICHHSYYLPYTLNRIAAFQKKLGDNFGAKETLAQSESVENTLIVFIKANFLSEKVLELVKRGEEANLMLNAVEQLAYQIEDCAYNDCKPNILTKIALAKQKLGNDIGAQETFQKAKIAAKKIYLNESTTSLLQNISVAQVEAGYIQEAQSTTYDIEEKYQAIAWLKIAFALAKQNKVFQAQISFAKAQECMNSVEKMTLSNEEKSEIKKEYLEHQAILQAEFKDLEGARASLAQAKKISKEIPEVSIGNDDMYISEAFSLPISASVYVAIVHMKNGALDKAKAIIEEILDPCDRATALLKLAASEDIIFHDSSFFKRVINPTFSKGSTLRLNPKFQ